MPKSLFHFEYEKLFNATSRQLCEYRQERHTLKERLEGKYGEVYSLKQQIEIGDEKVRQLTNKLAQVRLDAVNDSRQKINQITAENRQLRRDLQEMEVESQHWKQIAAQLQMDYELVVAEYETFKHQVSRRMNSDQVKHQNSSKICKIFFIVLDADEINVSFLFQNENSRAIRDSAQMQNSGQTGNASLGQKRQKWS